jgi:hypothetical protein
MSFVNLTDKNQGTLSACFSLPIENQSTPKKKGGNTRKNGKIQCPRRQKEPQKRVNHTRNIKFSNPLLSREAY